jgi:hypothetical protein
MKDKGGLETRRNDPDYGVFFAWHRWLGLRLMFRCRVSSCLRESRRSTALARVRGYSMVACRLRRMDGAGITDEGQRASERGREGGRVLWAWMWAGG